MDKEKNTFEYSYSAPTEEERKRIASIKRQYEEVVDSGEANFNKLKALDAKVKNTATIVALVLGIGGCLIFGTGLAMVLEWGVLVYGIIVMTAGVVPMAISYPSYNSLLKRGKKKYGKKIIAIADELLKNK